MVFVTDLREPRHVKPQHLSGPGAAERVRAAWLRQPLVAFARHRKVVTFYRQLHALTKAGVPLPTAFQQLTTFAPDARMKAGLQSVAADVRAGSTLGEALRKHGALFDDANVELVAFAEAAGRLEPVLFRILGHLEQVQKQRWRALFGALWPMYLLGAFIFIAPLLGVAQQMKPGASIGGLYLGGLVSGLFWVGLLLGVVLGTPLLVAALDATAPFDRFLRRLPLVSSPLRQLSASRLVLGLSLGSASGLDAPRGLALAAKASGSAAVLARLPMAEVRLRNGATFTEAIAALDALSNTELGTLSVAETTGTLDTTLEGMSRELEESSLRAVRLLTLLVTALVAVVLLFKLVTAMLGVLFGPVKQFYDTVGSGKLE